MCPCGALGESKKRSWKLQTEARGTTIMPLRGQERIRPHWHMKKHMPLRSPRGVEKEFSEVSNEVMGRQNDAPERPGESPHWHDFSPGLVLQFFSRYWFTIFLPILVSDFGSRFWLTILATILVYDFGLRFWFTILVYDFGSRFWLRF